ncbi:FimV/HubP family polar landmark protein [Methylophilus aquaticus]|uniref:FimV/HubP family polar landmark protein n=1 Tax=Methylophilus aquaticus TaxID=1971610 RepID=A0ABT9JVN7_9PROT|nr:FimV/HubP family polar landmark protein [Methylophilus aquaticus]MDP8568624.1 FimV/HubP family polar landmark protein [Methylophilus aquaticus]
MTSSSKLGEPLVAEIELLAVTPNELNSIQAALASEQVYQDQLLEKPASYPYIKIEVANSNKGLPVLKLSSSQPITEAFLDMLIQVDWPTGRLVKEYTLLLDPPGLQSNYVSEPLALPTAPANNTVVPTSNQTESSAKQANDRKASEPVLSQAEKKTAAASAELAKGTESTIADHETEQGDTLYAIARQMRPDNVSVEQMLAGLYQANPQAFAGKNMNRLKVGKILRMPDQATLEHMSQQQAKGLVAAQTADWLSYKNSLAKVVQQSPETNSATNSQQSSGKIGSAQAKPLPPKTAAKDILKLSAGDEKSSAQADKSAQKAMQDKVNAMQEDLTAKDHAIKEEKSRTADLEKQIADMKKLLAMKSDAMAKIQQDAAQVQKSAAPAEAMPQAEAPASAPQKVLPEQPAVIDATKSIPEAAEATPEQPVEQPSFILSLIQRLKQMNPALPFALVALPLLGCAWLIMRVRRKKQMHTFEEAIVTSPATEFQNNTVFGNTQMASGDTSFLTDFSQSAVGGMIDAHDVDPIAEAEVYMAYGRDAQAEEILRDAIQKDPNRQELKLKLLEIYHGAGNMAAFETLASDMYAKAGPNDLAWTKVVAMGQQLDPNNPLYRATAQATSVNGDEILADNADVATKEEGYHLNFEAPSLEFASSANEVVDSITATPFVLAEETTLQGAAEGALKDDDLATVTSEMVDAELPLMGSGSLPQAEKPLETIVTETSVVNTSNTMSDIVSLQEEAIGSIESSLQPDSPNEGAKASTQPEVWGDGLAGGLETLELNTESSSNPENELTPKSLDLPTLDFDVVDGQEKNDALNVVGENNLSPADAVFESLPDLSFELGTAPKSSESPSQDSSASNGMTFEEISLEAAELQLEEASAAGLNEIESFPEISLDVAPVATFAETAVVEAESEEVDTKLDLIKAYIDMEDVIGAKELIEEVLQEGGEKQRKRASELLTQLA